MCESTAYILKDGAEEPIFESVDYLEELDGQIKMVNLFGEEHIIKARIKTLSLVDHKIILEPYT
jgi:predicted RNA-binding protein